MLANCNIPYQATQRAKAQVEHNKTQIETTLRRELTARREVETELQALAADHEQLARERLRLSQTLQVESGARAEAEAELQTLQEQLQV